jgi:hypothetical protein
VARLIDHFLCRVPSHTVRLFLDSMATATYMELWHDIETVDVLTTFKMNSAHILAFSSPYSMWLECIYHVSSFLILRRSAGADTHFTPIINTLHHSSSPIIVLSHIYFYTRFFKSSQCIHASDIDGKMCLVYNLPF